MLLLYLNSLLSQPFYQGYILQMHWYNAYIHSFSFMYSTSLCVSNILFACVYYQDIIDHWLSVIVG